MKDFINKFTQGTFRNAFTYGTSSAITQLLMMIYLLLIANWLGPTQYGYIAAAYAATSLTSFIFNWGFNGWMIRAGSTSPQPQNLGGEVICIKTILGVVWGITLWFVLRFIRPELYLGNIVLLSILDIYFDSILGTILAIFLMTNRVRSGSIFSILSRAIRLILGIGIIIFAQKSIVLILILRLMGTVLITIIAWAFAKPAVHINFIELWKLFRKSLAFNISELLNQLYSYADVNILSLLGTDPELIGKYSIAINLINAIIMLPLGMYNALLPSLVNAYTNRTTFSHQIKQLFSGFFLLGLLLWGVSVSLSQPIIITLLGENYRASAEFLIQLAPILLMRTFNQANIAYLISVGWQAKRIIPQFIAVLVKFITGFLLFKSMNIDGIIVSSIVTESILAAVYLLIIFRHFNLYKRKS